LLCIIGLDGCISLRTGVTIGSGDVLSSPIKGQIAHYSPEKAKLLLTHPIRKDFDEKP
jgi:hypothetical protein